MPLCHYAWTAQATAADIYDRCTLHLGNQARSLETGLSCESSSWRSHNPTDRYSPGAGGGLGHLALQIGARGMGFRMIGIDAGEKEQLAKDCGAEAFFDVTKYGRDADGNKQLAADVKAATGGLGAAAVVVCTASNAAYAQALSFLKFYGTVVCVGVPEGEQVPIGGADPGTMLASQFRIVGSAVGDRREAIETLEMASR